MQTKILMSTKENIKTAAAAIKAGELVAFPTETVYGLGADALNPAAVRNVFYAKGRPADNPLIVHFDSADKIESVAYLDKRALKAVKRFMPGALSIVLKKKPHVPDEVTAGLDTVAVRIPSNPVAQAFLRECGVGVAAPSANTSSRPSPTAAYHVLEDLNGRIDYILDGGNCPIGLESTVLDFSSDKIRLLRRGGIPLEELRLVLGDIEVACSVESGAGSPKSPGMKYKHYSPNAKVYVREFGDIAGIESLRQALKGEGKSVVVLALSQIEEASIMDGEDEYARWLYNEFRTADESGIDAVICEKALDFGLGASINCRIIKAAGEINEQ